MSTDALKFRSGAEEGSDKVQLHLRSKTRVNLKNSSTSENEVDVERNRGILNQKVESERSKREEAVQSKHARSIELEVLKRSLESINSEKEQAKELAAARLTELNNYKQQVENLQEILGAKDNETRKLQNQVTTVSNRLSDVNMKFGIVKNQLQQENVDLKSALNAKDTHLVLADETLFRKSAEKEELVAKHRVIVEKFCLELQEKDSKIINLHEDSDKLDKQLKSALRSLSVAKESSSINNNIIRSQNAAIMQLKRELMQKKEEVVYLENQLRFSSDETASLDDQKNDLGYLKRKLLVELKHATAKVQSSRDGHNATSRQSREQREDMQQTLISQREQMLQKEISNYKTMIEDLKKKSLSDNKLILDFSSLIKALKAAQRNCIDKKSLEEFKKEYTELSKSSKIKDELIDELRSQKTVLEEKLKKAKKILKQNKMEMVTLREKVQDSQSQNFKMVRSDSQLLTKKLKEANVNSNKITELLDEVQIDNKGEAKQKLKFAEMKLKENKTMMAELREMLKKEQFKIFSPHSTISLNDDQQQQKADRNASDIEEVTEPKNDHIKPKRSRWSLLKAFTGTFGHGRKARSYAK